MNKLKYIDALRGWAVIGVIAVHCSQLGNRAWPFLFTGVFDNGAMGVQLFYVVSAFTLFLSHSRRANREQHPDFNFFIRRFFRIAPLYYLAIFYYLWQDGTGPRVSLGSQDGITTANVVSNFLFVHGLSPYWINSTVPGGWSISIEMMFYCMVPFLASRIKNLNGAIRFLMITCLLKTAADFVLTVFPVIPDTDLWNIFLYYYLPDQLPVFALGIIMFFLVKGDEEGSTSPLSIRMVTYATVAFLLTMFVGFNSIHLVFSAAYVVLGWSLSRRKSWLTNPVTEYLGKLSFSLYLCHFAVLHWMEHFAFVDFFQVSSMKGAFINYLLRFAALTGVSVVLATVTFYLIEQPFQKIGKMIIRRFETAQRPS